MSTEQSPLMRTWPEAPPYMKMFAGGSVLWEPTTNLTGPYMMYICVLAVVVLAISFVLVSRLRKNQKNDKDFAFEVDPDTVITNILERAIELETKFDLVCTRPSLKQKHIQCYGLAMSQFSGKETSADADKNEEEQGGKKPCNPYLTLRLVPDSLPDGWSDAPIDVYLQLVQNEQGTLYHFPSFVCNILHKDGEMYIVIRRPSVLGNSQSREEVRIEPAPGAVALASSWLYARDSNMLPDKVHGLGKPFAVFRPEGDSDFRIINISACGIRLRFLQDDVEKLPFAVEKFMELCLFLAVNTPHEKNNRLMLWLKAECKGLAPCTDPDCVDVRFSFTHWQQVYERSENIAWNEAVVATRVPPVMHWIMNSAYGMYGDRHIIDNAKTEPKEGN